MKNQTLNITFDYEQLAYFVMLIEEEDMKHTDETLEAIYKSCLSELYLKIRKRIIEVKSQYRFTLKPYQRYTLLELLKRSPSITQPYAYVSLQPVVESLRGD